MNIRTFQRPGTFFSRIMGGLFDKPIEWSSRTLSARKFEFEIAKEMSRSNRRSFDREFVVIQIGTQFPTHTEETRILVDELHRRLRMSDSVGLFREQLAALCPETNRDGGLVVANEIAKIGLDLNQKIETDVLVYPEDDSSESFGDRLLEGASFDGSREHNGKAPSHNGKAPGHTGSGINGAATTEDPNSSEETVLPRCSARGSSANRIVFSKPMATPLWKRLTDIAVAGLLLVLSLPIFMLSALAIKLTSRGPVFFKQHREGKDGRSFKIWKFRSMVDGAELQQLELRSFSEQNGPAFKLKNDPRVTSVGRYLRKTCVDELPQLVNVLMGQMSLVGPRPLPVDESVACSDWQRQRLVVLPGLTCIWQVEGGRATRFSDWMRMDLRYIRQRSFWFDLKLIAKTAVIAVMHRGSV